MIEINPIKDIEALMRWRQEVIEHVFGEKADSRLLEANRQYYITHIPNNSHIAFIAEYNGIEAGCGAVCFSEELPSPDNLSGKCAYLMNIYVREGFREHGIAHTIVKHLIAEAKLRGCDKIYLETTAEGKPVYNSLGFVDMLDMMKYYDTDH